LPSRTRRARRDRVGLAGVERCLDDIDVAAHLPHRESKRLSRAELVVPGTRGMVTDAEISASARGVDVSACGRVTVAARRRE
jgi:hypothetical protein